MRQKFTLALILPCFNEARRLQKTFETLREFFLKQWPGKNIALVFVDDGSSDSTFKMLESFQESEKDRLEVFVVRHETNCGKGAAIISGTNTVDADVYGFTDADVSFGLEPIPLFLQTLSTSEVVIATRKDFKRAHYSFFRKLVSKSFLFFSRQVTGIRAKDPQCGFKFFSAHVVKDIFPQIHQKRFAFDMECLLRIEKSGYKIAELPLLFSHDEKTSVRTPDGIRYLLDLFAIMDSLPFVFYRFIFQLVVLSLCLSLAIYGWVLWSGYFFSDDFTWLWFGQRVLEDPDQILALKAGSFFSPIMNIFYAILLAIFGPSAPLFFLVNIFIHAAVATLGGFLCFLLTRSRLAAFLTTLLITISGGAYEPIVWIGANMHSLATLFILSALCAYAGFLKTKQGALIFVSLFFQVLAYTTKEISVVLPILLIAIIIGWKQSYRDIPKTFSHVIFWFFSFCLAGLYAILQIILQEGGSTFAKNNYALGLQGLLRLPFALTDLFIPLKPIQNFLSSPSAVVFLLLIVLAILVVLKKYRKLSGVPFSFALALFSLLPTTFFATAHWWEPLASRYTYLPRVGAVMTLSIILTHYIVRNQAKRIISFTAVVIFIIFLSQIVFMFKIVALDYQYVYQSGRSLAQAAKLLDPTMTESLYVHPEHPFRGNNTHIIGAFAVFSGLKEEEIIFLTADERVALDPTTMLLYWSPKARQYELTSHEDIFDKFPLP